MRLGLLVPSALGRVRMAVQSLVRLLAGVSLPPQSFAEVIAERVRLIRLLAWGGRAPLAVLTAGHVLAAAPAALALTTGWLVGSLMMRPDSIADVAPALAVFAVVLALQQTGQVVQTPPVWWWHSRSTGAPVAWFAKRRLAS